jgi:precorrin-2 dehydrogenase/sirohydrochlorin ferrochelatase
LPTYGSRLGSRDSSFFQRHERAPKTPGGSRKMTTQSWHNSLVIAWQLKDKHVLVIGGGEVAASRIESVLMAGARVRAVSPRAGLHSATSTLVKEEPDRIVYFDRAFDASQDLVDIHMVLTAIDDVEKSREICTLCRSNKIPVNAADIPPLCDFYFGSQIRDGPLQIMVTTNGQSPKLANIIRTGIEQELPKHAGRAVERVGWLRTRLRERAPGIGGPLGRRRMKWMVKVCTSWRLEDLAELDENMIKKLLDMGWEKRKVPTFREVGGTRRLLQIPWTSFSLLTVFAFLIGALFAMFVQLYFTHAFTSLFGIVTDIFGRGR